MTYIERRSWASCRPGSAPTGSVRGALQPIADPMKLLLKEDIVPASAEKVAYFLGADAAAGSGVLVFCPDPLRAAADVRRRRRVNIGLLLILALTSIGVYGIILGGWASNNKFSLMGGLRSAAQMVSYEVPFGLSIVGVLMLARQLRPGADRPLSGDQRLELPPPDRRLASSSSWPMNAENNRTPFDLPEAESELVAGSTPSIRR